MTVTMARAWVRIASSVPGFENRPNEEKGDHDGKRLFASIVGKFIPRTDAERGHT
jgi:hypothetical protein